MGPATGPSNPERPRAHWHRTIPVPARTPSGLPYPDDLDDHRPQEEVNQGLTRRPPRGLRHQVDRGVRKLRTGCTETPEYAPRLSPAPATPYDLPIYATAKVHRDHHIEVARALYSIPGNLIGQRVDVRADAALVRVFCRGALVKVHPRTAPGGRSTDPADLPAERTTYAMRDLDALARMAAKAGPNVGAYASAVLDHPLPWTKMRQVYALLGLVKRWGPERVDAACARALEAEAVSVGLIGRMLEKGTESAPAATPAPVPEPAGKARFSREDEHFATTRRQAAAGDATGGAA
ncbi:MAG: Mu transposase domain-containing protein [Acidimicrobiales bacterium]